MPNYSPEAVSLARAEAQRVLSMSPSFVRMNEVEQLALYRSLVNAALAQIQPRSTSSSVSRQMAGLPGIGGGGLPGIGGGGLPGIGGGGLPGLPGSNRGGSNENASNTSSTPAGGLQRDAIENKRFDQLPQIGADFIQQIDFPTFVQDLLKGVFDANLKVTLQQMKTYQDLLKTASQSVAQFVSKIDNSEAFAYLASNQGDLFSMGFEDDEDGKQQPVLTDKEGNKLDIGDNEVKARIMDAKIAMAKEHRAMLRETILMGITRLVVEKGVVEASVLFDVSATEDIKTQGKAAQQDEKTRATEDTPGFFGNIFGGSGTTTQERHSKITVSSVKAVADSKLAAQIKGSVKIQFKSDYFKLDNFAALYQDGRDGGAPAAAAIPGAAVGGGGGGGGGAAPVIPPGQTAGTK